MILNGLLTMIDPATTDVTNIPAPEKIVLYYNNNSIDPFKAFCTRRTLTREVSI